MNIPLTPELEQFVHRKVESGLYPSAGEVVREALRLLDERDRLEELRVDALRADLMVGIEQADRGELLDGPAVFDRVRERLRAKAGGPS